MRGRTRFDHARSADYLAPVTRVGPRAILLWSWLAACGPAGGASEGSETEGPASEGDATGESSGGCEVEPEGELLAVLESAVEAGDICFVSILSDEARMPLRFYVACDAALDQPLTPETTPWETLDCCGAFEPDRTLTADGTLVRVRQTQGDLGGVALISAETGALLVDARTSYRGASSLLNVADFEPFTGTPCAKYTDFPPLTEARSLPSWTEIPLAFLLEGGAEMLFPGELTDFAAVAKTEVSMSALYIFDDSAYGGPLSQRPERLLAVFRFELAG